MKLEVGKSYVDGYDQIVNIVSDEYVDDGYPFEGDNGEVYTGNGEYLQGDVRNPMNLIREHTASPSSLSISIDTKDMRSEMERIMRACQAFIDEYDK